MVPPLRDIIAAHARTVCCELPSPCYSQKVLNQLESRVLERGMQLQDIRAQGAAAAGQPKMRGGVTLGLACGK